MLKYCIDLMQPSGICFRSEVGFIGMAGAATGAGGGGGGTAAANGSDGAGSGGGGSRGDTRMTSKLSGW